MKLQQDQLPLYYEGLQLRRRLVLAGWPLALAVAGLGVVLVGTSAQPLVDASGLVVGVLGAVLIAGLVRCRRCEIVISGRAVTSTVGPLRRRAPVEWLERGELRRSRSWRRLFADSELVFELPDHGPSFILPTAEPEALEAALREARTAGRTRTSE
jgi:hypothetical protein